MKCLKVTCAIVLCFACLTLTASAGERLARVFGDNMVLQRGKPVPIWGWAGKGQSITVNCNAWGAFLTGKPAVDYSVVKDLKGSPEWQTVTVALEELLPTNPGISDPLPNWQTVTELKLSPSGEVVKGGLKEKIVGAAWQGPREIRNLRWEGGQYAAQQSAGGTLSEAEQQKQFNDSINASLEQEKIQAK